MARQLKQAVIEEPVPAAPVKSLFERVAGYLDTIGWSYNAYEEKHYFSADFIVKDGKVRVVLDVDEPGGWQRVQVFSLLPVFVPGHRRAAMAESISRINYTMIFGNLEMDPADGEVRVRTIVESDGALSDAMFARVLASNLDAAGRFFAPILAVAFGNAAPEEVLDMVAKDEATAVPPSTTLQ